jgi:hypothetical protein
MAPHLTDPYGHPIIPTMRTHGEYTLPEVLFASVLRGAHMLNTGRNWLGTLDKEGENEENSASQLYN